MDRHSQLLLVLHLNIGMELEWRKKRRLSSFFFFYREFDLIKALLHFCSSPCGAFKDSSRENVLSHVKKMNSGVVREARALSCYWRGGGGGGQWPAPNMEATSAFVVGCHNCADVLKALLVLFTQFCIKQCKKTSLFPSQLFSCQFGGTKWSSGAWARQSSSFIYLPICLFTHFSRVRIYFFSALGPLFRCGFLPLVRKH